MGIALVHATLIRPDVKTKNFLTDFIMESWYPMVTYLVVLAACCGHLDLTGAAEPDGMPGAVSSRELQARSLMRGTKVYFTATMQKMSQIKGPFSIKTLVQYPYVVDNVGKGYDKTTGVFTCKVPGLYYFSTSVLSQYKKVLHIELMKNTCMLVDGYCYAPEGFCPAVAHVVVALKKGDKVYVRQYENSALNGNFATFSGYLMQRDYTR